MGKNHFTCRRAHERLYAPRSRPTILISSAATHSRRRWCARASLALAALLLPGAAHAVVGSNSGDNVFNGLYINEAVGAGAYYTQGFFGTEAIIANIEAGYSWNGHESLQHLTTFLSDPTITGTSLGEFDWHATM